MKDDILIRYINKHCTATEEKEVLEWLKEKDSRQRLFELEQIWGLKTEMRFSDKGRMDEAYRQLSGQLGLSKQAEKREKSVQRFTIGEWWKYAAVLVTVCLFCNKLVLYHERGTGSIQYGSGSERPTGFFIAE